MKFSNTVMCYFWDCDKTIRQKLVRWRFEIYYFRLTIGNISWCTLEMISGTKFFHSGIKKEMKYYFIPVGTSFKLKLNSILGAT